MKDDKTTSPDATEKQTDRSDPAQGRFRVVSGPHRGRIGIRLREWAGLVPGGYVLRLQANGCLPEEAVMVSPDDIEPISEPSAIHRWPRAAAVVHRVSRGACTFGEIHLAAGHETAEETRDMLTDLAREGILKLCDDPAAGGDQFAWELTPEGVVCLGLMAHLARDATVHLTNVSTGRPWCSTDSADDSPCAKTSLVSEVGCERCLFAVIQISESARSSAEARLSALIPRPEGRYALGRLRLTGDGREIAILRPDGVPLAKIVCQSDLGAEIVPLAKALISALYAGRIDLTRGPTSSGGADDESRYAPTAWIPHREFEAGDVVTRTMDPCQGPLYRLITAVRVGPPEVDPDLDDQDMSPVRTYTWEHLDRGILHGHQRRDDDDYQSEWSTDPQMWHWRRVLRGAQRGEP